MEAYRRCRQYSYTGSEALAMPAMTLMLLTPVLPFRFPLLDLCMRDRNDLLRQLFETLEWRFGLFGLRLLHSA